MINAIIFDYGRTLADVDTHLLFPGVEKMLESLHKEGLKMAIVSRTTDPVQRRKDFKKYKLDRFIQIFELFSREGTKKFDNVLKDLGVRAENCAVIGDRIKSEIVEGNKIGLTTIWIKQGIFASELPETPEEDPDFIIDSLDEINPLINSLRKLI